MTITNVIWKFPIPLQAEDIIVSMPKDSQILHLAIDPKFYDICIWVKLDPNDDIPKENRRFTWIATGQRTESENLEKYIGTMVLKLGLVFHLFELPSDSENI